jgi:hypothetical protein
MIYDPAGEKIKGLVAKDAKKHPSASSGPSEGAKTR